MTRSYITKEDDALDLICYHEYGSTQGTAEKVLESNPQIKFNAERLPRGIKINLPDVTPKPDSSRMVKLWD